MGAMDLTRRAALATLAGLPFAVDEFASDDSVTTVSGLNVQWDGVIRFQDLQDAYETAMRGSFCHTYVVSRRTYAFIRYKSGNLDHGWFDFVKADIRARLAKPKQPPRLPA
jgi:hypothetical protein